MTKLLTLSNSEELETVTQKELSLIAFGIPWSSPCRIQRKILVNFKGKYSGTMAIAQVDVEKHPGLARKCNIQTVPTLIMYRKRREIKRLVGLQSVEALNRLIQATRLSGTDKSATGNAYSRL